MTLQLFLSEVPYVSGKFRFLFHQCGFEISPRSSKTLDSGMKVSRTCLVGSLGALLGAEHGQLRLLHHLKHCHAIANLTAYILPIA